MNSISDDRMRELLRQALPRAGTVEVQRDLWPQMLRLLERRQLRMNWFDWALAVLAVILCILAPASVLGLLFHL